MQDFSFFDNNDIVTIIRDVTDALPKLQEYMRLLLGHGQSLLLKAARVICRLIAGLSLKHSIVIAVQSAQTTMLVILSALSNFRPVCMSTHEAWAHSYATLRPVWQHVQSAAT